MTTFGIEPEFQTNGPALIAELHRLGLAEMSQLHGYHCNCEQCDFGNGFAFRGQRDSTVSGEIISRVYDKSNPEDWRDFLSDVAQLQDAAVQVDAEPGPSAGCHVHVRKPRGENDRGVAFLGFVLAENHLAERLAPGRFTAMRGMNDSAALSTLQRSFRDRRYQPPNEVIFESLMTELGGDSLRNYVPYRLVQFHDAHFSADRHSTLNVRTSHGTWEYRLWNSTRSAWRYELLVRTSLVLVQPEFTFTMLDIARSEPPDFTTVMLAADQLDNGLGELMQRQADYVATKAPFAPTNLSPLASEQGDALSALLRRESDDCYPADDDDYPYDN